MTEGEQSQQGETAQQRYRQKLLYLQYRREERSWTSFDATLNSPDLNAQEELNNVEDRVTLEKILPNLSYLRQTVLECRFKYEMTREEIAETLSISPDRVKELELDALHKLSITFYRYRVRF
jgi:RNA polymerase sigma factor (sigma-70 family)